MSQAEFELYLSILGKFLRLNAAQRAEIADELRDHLETRLEELTSRGLSHDDAIARAINEFGDASELAHHFTQLAKQRRRRFIMRSMYASAGAATAVILLMWGLMRTPEPQMEPNVVAQQGEGITVELLDGKDVSRSAIQENPSDNSESEIEQKLAQPIEHIDFAVTPLRDTLAFIADEIQADIVYADANSMEQAGVAGENMDNATVTLSLEHTTLKASAAIELILEQATGGLLTYSVRDGYLFVHPASQRRENLTIEIYNVRDLLQGVNPTMRYEQQAAGAMGGMGGPGFTGPMAAGRGGRGPMAGGPMGGGPMAGGMGASRPGDGELTDVAPVEALIRVIVAATGDAWAHSGTGRGTIEEFDGLLVVRQSEESHREIRNLLGMLRTAKNGTPDNELRLDFRQGR